MKLINTKSKAIAELLLQVQRWVTCRQSDTSSVSSSGCHSVFPSTYKEKLEVPEKVRHVVWVKGNSTMISGSQNSYFVIPKN